MKYANTFLILLALCAAHLSAEDAQDRSHDTQDIIYSIENENQAIDDTPVPMSQQDAPLLFPHQIVEAALMALRARRWNAYFDYFDIEALYRAFPEHEAEYITLPRDEQVRRIIRYRESLQRIEGNTVVDTVPLRYEIGDTTYNTESASVHARLFFYARGIEMHRDYTYFLVRRNGSWIIIDYMLIINIQ